MILVKLDFDMLILTPTLKTSFLDLHVTLPASSMVSRVNGSLQLLLSMRNDALRFPMKRLFIKENIIGTCKAKKERKGAQSNVAYWSINLNEKKR